MMIVNKKIGDMTKSELKDFIIELQEENSRYERINQKYKEVIDEAIKYMKDFIFEPLLTNEDRKLIMYNDNLKK